MLRGIECGEQVMTDSDDVLEQVRKALGAESRFDPHRYPLRTAFDRGVLTLEGEVVSIAVKKLVLERAAAVPAVAAIVDRVHVVPAQKMGDREIRDHVRDALTGEPAFSECAIRVRDGEHLDTIRGPDTPRGDITLSVVENVVTLDGDIPSGVLAWWIPGSRDVVNGLGVEPPEEDNDDEVSDAVRLVLEKDPFVDATRIHVSARDYVVTLEGLVPAEGEREMAEFDAWYVFGVDKVVNRIDVRP
jgi:osmotically-inducible protein OsmY